MNIVLDYEQDRALRVYINGHLAYLVGTGRENELVSTAMCANTESLALGLNVLARTVGLDRVSISEGESDRTTMLDAVISQATELLRRIPIKCPAYYPDAILWAEAREVAEDTVAHLMELS